MNKSIIAKLIALEMKAKEFGFYWPRWQNIMDQISSECNEVQEILTGIPLDQARLQEEIGDLLHAVYSLCVYSGLDPEQTLAKSVEKFDCRLSKTISFAQEAGLNNLRGKTSEEMMFFWDKAKK